MYFGKEKVFEKCAYIRKNYQFKLKLCIVCLNYINCGDNLQ